MIALMKTVTYGIMHVAVATILAYILTGSWTIAISIGLLEPIVQTFFFYFHERVWESYKIRRAQRLQDAVTESAGSEA